MKIAIETNDGINIASPNNLLKNFMVFEVTENRNQEKIRGSTFFAARVSKLKPIKSIGKTRNMLEELGECSSVISHGFNRSLLNNLRKVGVDVYITFQNRIDDAVERYLKDNMIHTFH